MASTLKSMAGVEYLRLAKRIGRSQEFVTRRIQLLRLPERIREEIMRQRITPSVALEMLPLDKGAIEEFADFVIKNPLTRNEIRHIVKVSKAKFDENGPTNYEEKVAEKYSKSIACEKELYLLDKALRKTIAVMKSTMVNFDDILNNVNENWILKELLMQYRLIIHGDIDTFLKLRKRLRVKIPKDYLGLLGDETLAGKQLYKPSGDKVIDADASIHLWATKGIWQKKDFRYFDILLCSFFIKISITYSFLIIVSECYTFQHLTTFYKEPYLCLQM